MFFNPDQSSQHTLNQSTIYLMILVQLDGCGSSAEVTTLMFVYAEG